MDDTKQHNRSCGTAEDLDGETLQVELRLSGTTGFHRNTRGSCVSKTARLAISTKVLSMYPYDKIADAIASHANGERGACPRYLVDFWTKRQTRISRWPLEAKERDAIRMTILTSPLRQTHVFTDAEYKELVVKLLQEIHSHK